MNRLRATYSVPYASRDIAPLSGTPQYATSGNPQTGVPATQLPAYAWNMIQEELMAIQAASGLTADDTNWAQLVQALWGGPGKNVQVFSANGSWTAPAWVTRVEVEMWGGAGGGGGVNGSNCSASGGSGGGYATGNYAVTPNATYSVMVGAGGVSGTATPTNGGAGGTSSFGSLISATGGAGGLLSTSGVANTPGSPGTGVGGARNQSGNSGAVGFMDGASKYRGGSGGPSHGCSYGDTTDTQSNANPGVFPGQGGNGTATTAASSFAGGAGAAGLVIVRW